MNPDPMTLASIVAALLGPAVPVSKATEPAATGGLPDASGFYAWWANAAIPRVPVKPHPENPSLGLLYVGIAPRGASSSQTVRRRVVDNHLNGNTGSSTFRFTLAAILLEELDLHPEKRKLKFVLPKPDNRRLSDWQRTHLSLTWCESDEPWMLENEVILAMQPSLNLASNSEHPFYATLKKARTAFRSAASGTSPMGPTRS